MSRTPIPVLQETNPGDLADTVLVVEYGYLDSSDDITRTGPGSSIVGINTSSYSSATRFYNISSQPMTALGDRRMGVACGCVVGGSSAVNGMVFDRGSAEDYDAWVWAAGEEHQDEYGKEWGWDNFLPSFRKSVTFHPPTDEMVEQYQMTYDMDAWGGDTPIHASYPPFQWPAQRRWTAPSSEHLLTTTPSRPAIFRDRLGRTQNHARR